MSQMCVSHRIDSTLEALADLPEGDVSVDLLARTCLHTKEGTVDLPLVEELLAWLTARTKQADGTVVTLTQASLVLSYAFRMPTDRTRIVLFDLACKAQLSVGKRVVEGAATNAVWYERSSNKRLQSDGSPAARRA